MVFRTSRRFTLRGRPPGFAAGSTCSTKTHCPSVKSVKYDSQDPVCWSVMAWHSFAHGRTNSNPLLLLRLPHCSDSLSDPQPMPTSSRSDGGEDWPGFARPPSLHLLCFEALSEEQLLCREQERDVTATGGIQISGGFIGQHQGRVDHKGSRNGNSLLLTAG